MKDVKEQQKPSVLKREHSDLQNMKFFTFFLFYGSFLSFWMRIQPKINADPYGSGSGPITLNINKQL